MAETPCVVNGVEIPGCVVKEIEKKLYKTLKDVFRYDSYRSLVQKRAVEAVANSGQDVYVSMPTGAGKSLCYQLPSLVSERCGVTMVVSPLIALMTDQIERMRSIGICTETINSKMTASEREKVKADLVSPLPKTKLLYITPELANTSGFHMLINHLFNHDNIARIVVDEAHCVSQWGHSFRPDYLRLGELREKYTSVPWVALTATASAKVMDDILLQLKLCHPVAIFKTSCFRPNLFYDVVFKEALDDPYENLKEFAYLALGDHWEMSPPNERGCGIVYCRTRDNCEELSFKLSNLGLLTKPYHAGIKPALRKETQTNWMEGKIPVIAATVSFGMGIDKATVRFVAHWCVSQSVAGYYQESGRAGRDGQPAKCRIYYSRKDRDTIIFLLKKDEKAAKSKMNKVKASTSVKSFSTMIKYCEESVCRHYLLAREFGDDIPDCKKHCDVCCTPKAVERKIAQFENSFLGSKIQKISKNSNDDSSDLYGGGRKGQKEETEMAYLCDDEYRGTSERSEGRALSSLISDQFEMRRGPKEKKLKYSAASAKILEPFLKKIPALSITAREKYFDKLIEEIQQHLQACASNSQCPPLKEKDIKNCVAAYELNLYKSKGSIHSYRKDFINLFKSLQEASRQVEVHPIIARYDPNLVLTEKSKPVSKERLFNILESVTKQKGDNSASKKEHFSSSQSCSDSHRTGEGSSRQSDISDELKRKPRTISSDSIHCEDGDLEKPQSLKMLDSDSESSMKNSPVRSSFSRNVSVLEASKTKPMIQYFFESVTLHAEDGTNKFSDNPFMAVKSPEKLLSNQNDSRVVHSVESSIQPSSNSEMSSNPRKRKKSEEPAIPMKQITTEKQKKEQTKTTSQIQNDNLKKAADLVRKHLNPQYKANKISKDLFKIVCRSISHRLVEAGAVNDKAAKLEVEKLFQQYSVVQAPIVSTT